MRICHHFSKYYNTQKKKLRYHSITLVVTPHFLQGTKIARQDSLPSSFTSYRLFLLKIYNNKTRLHRFLQGWTYRHGLTTPMSNLGAQTGPPPTHNTNSPTCSVLSVSLAHFGGFTTSLNLLLSLNKVYFLRVFKATGVFGRVLSYRDAHVACKRLLKPSK